MGEEHRMVIPGILEHIPDVCDFVIAAARRAGFNERAIYHCQMAVDEACTNIIEHGFEGQYSDGQIEIIYRDEADHSTINIIDDSPPFDPLGKQDPDPHRELTEREGGGWGIYFIKQMMDDVKYIYQDGRNHLLLTKRKTDQTLARPRSDTGPHIYVRSLAENIWEVAPKGRMESPDAPNLQAVLNAQMDDGHFRLIVNMGSMTYISSSGLKVLVNAWRRAHDQQGELVLASMNPHIRELFEMVGFDQVFKIYESVEDALHELRGQTV